MTNKDSGNQKEVKPIESWIDGDMLFLREQDKIRIQHIPTALSNEHPYVALCGPRVDLLNYYFEYLYSKLKTNDSYQLEVFFSVTTDSLLEFYNKRLADISVNAAKTSTDEELQRKILVISDCSTMGKGEWDLLARLLIDFPGANCGLLVICEEPFSAEVDSFVKLLGSRMMQCHCGFPDSRELASFLDASAMTPYHSHYKKKLAALGITGSDLDTKQVVSSIDEKTDIQTSDVTGKQKTNKFLILLFSLILVLAVGVAYQLNKQEESDFGLPGSVSSFESDSPEVNQNAESVTNETSDVVEVVQPIQEQEIAVKLSEENIIEEEKNDLLEAVSNDASKRDEKSPDPTEQPEFVQQQVDQPISTDARLPPNAEADILSLLDNATESSSSPALEDQVAVKSSDPPLQGGGLDNEIDPSAFYLQHAALSSQASATSAISGVFNSFSSAFFVPQLSQQKTWYVVFSGPYISRNDAIEVAKENAVTADVVIVRGEYITSRIPAEEADDGR